ncbi:DNA polymerase III subunit delta [Candidatus Ecksteinia adelgidicola]|nr:DNA polymerase III subunit delta [Candidatus Ecksteinia adelgidicola]
MIYLYPEQLFKKLQKKNYTCYFLIGNEPIILQESYDIIQKVSQKQKFTKHHKILLDMYTNWEKIFDIFQEINLFSHRQTLLFMFSEKSFTLKISSKLLKLSTLFHNDVLLIFSGPFLTKIQKNSIWFKNFSSQSVYVNCQSPEHNQLPRWVDKRAKNMHLNLENTANQLLCYCYEGNLLALSQTLEKLSLLYPDNQLTLSRVKKIVNNSCHFKPFHWTSSILSGNSKRTWRILKYLKKENIEPVILVRALQRELLLVILLRYKSLFPLSNIFNQYKIYYSSHNQLLLKAIQRLSMNHIRQAIQYLTNIELILKKNYEASIWPKLEMLSIFLCDAQLYKNFIIHLE